MNYIIGNGISVYIIKACFDYLNIKSKIISEKTKTHFPKIMHLKYNNDKELYLFQKVFNIKNISKYVKHIKVGYLYNGKICNVLTEEMKLNYLHKQDRKDTDSALNDTTSAYNCLDLVKIYKKIRKNINKKDICFVKNISKKIINEISKEDKIYDTTGKLLSIKKNPYYFYLVNEKNKIKDYDYVYDCDNNFIKRYTKTTSEYIRAPKKDYIKLINYYDEFKVINKDNIYCIGRYATGTQTKQKDIIKYILGDKYEI